MTHSTHEPLRFAYWVPNVSGGLVVSKIEQRTDWGYDYNKRLAVLAENNGFEYALSQVRYMASYGAAYQHESTSISLALALATERLKVIAAVHPGLWQPGVLAKLIASADVMTEGPDGRQRGQRLVQGRVHQARRALARARRALPPLRGVHPLPPRDLDLRPRRARRRLLPPPRLRPQAQAGRGRGPGSPRDLHGGQLDRRPGHGRSRRGLVLHERQHPRGHRRADPRRQRRRPGPRPQR